jgi:hypothetical protein
MKRQGVWRAGPHERLPAHWVASAGGVARTRGARIFAIAALVAVSVYLVIVGCLTLVHMVDEREECGGASAQVCRALRASDQAECRAGEGCGAPMIERKR